MSSSNDDILLDVDEPHKPFIKYKHLIAFLALGYAIDFIGTWAKILHLSFSNMLLTIAVFVKFMAALIFIIKILSDKKTRSFLNN